MFQVQYSKFEEIDNILEDYFLITSESLYERFINRIHFLKGKIIFIETLVNQSNNNTINNIFKSNKILVAFGGGKVIDKVKLLAKKNNIDFIVIPTTLSHDGVCNSMAILNNNKHLICKLPKKVIFDFSLIKNAPIELITAGYCDVLGNKNAIEDCELAEDMNKYKCNEIAKIHSEASFNLLKDINKIDNGDIFLKKLSNAIILSGLSEKENCNTFTVSGSEHLIAHAIDCLYPKNKVLHGIKVAFGCLMIDKLKKQSFYKNQFKKLKILKYIEKELSFAKNKEQIIRKAIQIGKEQKKYTYLEFYKK